MLRISVLRGWALARFKSYHVVPNEEEIMPLLPLPVLAVSRSAACLRFPVLQTIPSPLPEGSVKGAESLFTWGDNTPSNWLSRWEHGLPSRPSRPHPPVASCWLFLGQLPQIIIDDRCRHLMGDGRIILLWQAERGEAVGENGLKQSRANKETASHPTFTHAHICFTTTHRITHSPLTKQEQPPLI